MIRRVRQSVSQSVTCRVYLRFLSPLFPSFLRSFVRPFLPLPFIFATGLCLRHVKLDLCRAQGGREGGEGTLHRSLFGGVKCWDEGNVCKYILTTFELVLLNIERNATIIDKLLTSYDSPSCILFLPYVSMEHSQPKTQETGKHAAS